MARDVQLDREILVKVVKKSDFENPEGYFEEARIIHQAKHPNVVEIHFASHDQEHVYLSMPYYRNGSLNKLLNERFLSVKEIIAFSLQFLSGVHFIHSNGLLHLDIKPANILFNDAGVAVLADFGLAKYVDEYGFVLEENGYIRHDAPENFDSEERDVQSDIYQIGLTLYRMCNGNKDFTEQWNRVLHPQSAIQDGVFPNRNKFLPHIPNALRTVVKKAIAVDIRERYRDVLDIVNDLCKIDKALDWTYNYSNQTGTHVWEVQESKTIKRLTLTSNNDQFQCRGVSISRSTGRETRKRDWEEDYPTEDKAFRAIQGILSRYEINT
nr:serine/threonine-protein kinase [Brevibacillus borstelensis]